MANQDFRVKNGLQVGLGASVVGIVTAESFTGSAVGLTSVPSASLTGTISSERLSGTYDIDILGTVSGATISATTATVTEQLNVGAGNTGVFATATDGTLSVSGIATFKDRVIFDSTNSIQIPVGTDAEKDAVGTAVTGQIRYNTTNSQFEGFGPGNDWGSLGGVKDVDGDTYVKPESSPGSDEDALTFFTAGTERAVIDSNGKVGIGTTNPTKALDVVGYGTENGIRVGDTHFFAFDDSGSANKGSPTFQNLNTNGNTVLRVLPNGTGRSQFEFFATDYFANAGIGTTTWNNLRIFADNNQGEIRIDTSAATEAGVAKSISIETNVEPGGGTRPNQYQLYLDVNGNIGLGTNAPSSTLDLDGTLDVSGISTFQDRVIFDSTNSIQIPVGTSAERDAVGTAVTGQIRYNTTLSSFEGYGPGGEWGTLGGVKDIDQDTYITAQKDLSVDDDALRFYTNGTEQVSIDSTGKVGIGSTQPTATLDLDGTLNVSGVSTFQGNVAIAGTERKLVFDAEIVASGLHNRPKIQIDTPTSNRYYEIYALDAPTVQYVRHLAADLDYNISVSDDRTFLISGGGSFTSASNTPGILDNKIAFKIVPESSTELRFNKEKRFETTGYGVTVTGGLNVSGVSTFQDDVNIGIGGTTAVFDISAGRVGINSTTPTATLDVKGTLNVSGITTIGGLLHAYNPTVSTTGVTTHLKVQDGNVYWAVEFEGNAGNNTRIPYITSNKGLYFSSDGDFGFSNYAGTENYLQWGAAAGQLDLLYGNSSQGHTNAIKLSTKSYGIDVSGDINVTGAASSITFDPNNNNGETFFIRGEANGNATIENSSELYVSSTHLYIQKPGGTTTMAEFIQDGAVKLNHNNITKLQTHDYGIDVTGRVETDTLNVSGISTFASSVFVGAGSSVSIGGTTLGPVDPGIGNMGSIQLNGDGAYAYFAGLNVNGRAAFIQKTDPVSNGGNGWHYHGLYNVEHQQWSLLHFDGSNVGAAFTSTLIYGGGNNAPVYVYPNYVRLNHIDGSTVNTRLETTGYGVSVTGGLNVSGIATLGTVKISSGIITATSGIVTYHGDGSQLSGIDATSLKDSNGVVRAQANTDGTISIGTHHSIVSITTSHTASAGTPFTIDTFATSENDLAEYTIHVGYGNTIQAQKVLVMHDGTTAYSQEYAVMSQPSKIVSIEASIFGSNVLLRATPESGVSGITTYKIVRGGLV